MSVRSILQAAQEAGFSSPLPPRWTALVVLTEVDSGGRPDAVTRHFGKANQYPGGWSAGDHLRYGARILLRTPIVTAELTRLGIESVPEAAEQAAEAVTEPLVEVARLPLRVLQWLTDPGTILRIVKVIGGGALILAGVAIAARPTTEAAAGKVVGAVTAGKIGKGR